MATGFKSTSSRQKGPRFEQAANGLTEKFEVDRETALADVRECLEDLVARQILVAE